MDTYINIYTYIKPQKAAYSFLIFYRWTGNTMDTTLVIFSEYIKE